MINLMFSNNYLLFETDVIILLVKRSPLADCLEVLMSDDFKDLFGVSVYLFSTK